MLVSGAGREDNLLMRELGVVERLGQLGEHCRVGPHDAALRIADVERCACWHLLLLLLVVGEEHSVGLMLYELLRERGRGREEGERRKKCIKLNSTPPPLSLYP